MKIKSMILALTAGACTAAHADSSVVLYGIVDNGIAWQSSGAGTGAVSGGHSAVKMTSGVWAGSRFGLRGTEDLGGGMKAVFTLESGVNTANGTSQYANGIFTRQAWVGLSSARYGALTAGRQYTAYYTMLSANSPTTWITGYFGAHPGDIDSLDNIYRANNSLVYISPRYHGFTFGASYALGGTPGSIDAGSTWSTGLQYDNGPLVMAAGFQRINNATSGGGTWGANSTAQNGLTTSGDGNQAAVSSINNGYITAQAQQRFAVTAGYQFNDAWGLSMSYSNVQYIPGIKSTFHDQAVFNTIGAVLHYKPVTAWDLGAGYSYTRATQANGITDAAQYNQFTLSQYYSLSKRTGVYAVEAYQRANGSTLNGAHIIAATASIGDGFNGAPSSSASQLAVGIGLVHRF